MESAKVKQLSDEKADENKTATAKKKQDSTEGSGGNVGTKEGQKESSEDNGGNIEGDKDLIEGSGGSTKTSKGCVEESLEKNGENIEGERDEDSTKRNYGSVGTKDGNEESTKGSGGVIKTNEGHSKNELSSVSYSEIQLEERDEEFIEGCGGHVGTKEGEEKPKGQSKDSKQKNRFKSQIQDLENKVEGLKSQINDKQKEIDRLKPYEELSRSLNKNLVSVMDDSSECFQVNKEDRELTEDFSSWEVINGSLKDEIVTKNLVIENERFKLEKVKTEKELTMHLQTLKDYAKKDIANQQTIFDLEGKLKDIETRMKEKEAELSDCRREMSDLKKKNDENLRIIQKLKENMKKTTDEKAQAEKKFRLEMQKLVEKHKQEVKNINDEVKRINSKVVNNCETEIRSLKSYQTKLQQEIKNKEIEQKNTLDVHQKQSRNYEQNMLSLRDQLDNIKRRFMASQNEVLSLTKDKQDLLLRLSKVAGANLTYDNPNIADLSDENRPTKLAEVFSELYDNEWTDAFESLPFDIEKESTDFMLDILMKTSKICSKLSVGHSKRIKDGFCKLILTDRDMVKDWVIEKKSSECQTVNQDEIKTIASRVEDRETKEYTLENEKTENIKSSFNTEASEEESRKEENSNVNSKTAEKTKTPKTDDGKINTTENKTNPPNTGNSECDKEESHESEAHCDDKKDDETEDNVGTGETQTVSEDRFDTNTDEHLQVPESSLDTKAELLQVRESIFIANAEEQLQSQESEAQHDDTRAKGIDQEEIVGNGETETSLETKAHDDDTRPKDIDKEKKEKAGTEETVPKGSFTMNAEEQLKEQLENNTNTVDTSSDPKSQETEAQHDDTGAKGIDQDEIVGTGETETSQQSEVQHDDTRAKGIDKEEIVGNGETETSQESKAHDDDTRPKDIDKAKEEKVGTKEIVPKGSFTMNAEEQLKDQSENNTNTVGSDTSSDPKSKESEAQYQDTRAKAIGIEKEENVEKGETQTVPGDSLDTIAEEYLQEISIESDFDLLTKEQRKTIMDAKIFFETELTKEVETAVVDLTCKAFKIDKTEHAVLVAYIEKCVNICWLMCRHNPPVHMQIPDLKEIIPFDTNMFKPYTKSGKYIDHIVWPPLFLHEDGPLLCKGVAQGRSKEK